MAVASEPLASDNATESLTFCERCAEKVMTSKPSLGKYKLVGLVRICCSKYESTDSVEVTTFRVRLTDHQSKPSVTAKMSTCTECSDKFRKILTLMETGAGATDTHCSVC